MSAVGMQPLGNRYVRTYRIKYDKMLFVHATLLHWQHSSEQFMPVYLTWRFTAWFLASTDSMIERSFCWFAFKYNVPEMAVRHICACTFHSIWHHIRSRQASGVPQASAPAVFTNVTLLTWSCMVKICRTVRSPAASALVRYCVSLYPAILSMPPLLSRDMAVSIAFAVFLEKVYLRKWRR